MSSAERAFFFVPFQDIHTCALLHMITVTSSLMKLKLIIHFRFIMGCMLRSDEMTKCQMYLQREVVFDVLAELGEMGCVQFIDVCI